MKRKLFAFIAVVCSAVLTQAQVTPVVSGSKDKILIGEPLKLTFELKAIERNAPIKWKFPDSLEHFEYISFDTSDILKREITITSWDSGAWQLQGVSVIVPSNVNGKPRQLRFAPKEIKVEYDTTGSAILNDIKPIIEVTNFAEEWIAYIVAAVTVLSLLLLIYIFRRWKAKQATVVTFEPIAGAYDEFSKALNELKLKNWNTQPEQKEYFSQLSFIAKRFLERSLRQPFSKFTTDETEFHLSPAIGRTDAATFIQVLRLSDAVKFAKFAAPQNECMDALSKTETILKQIHQQLSA
ncbi:MAG: hypothetical protein K2X48_09000 [Chitinophagaceae bacterium]|nr:hypothetical protein [Chitinophagaceae bacterium]